MKSLFFLVDLFGGIYTNLGWLLKDSKLQDGKGIYLRFFAIYGEA